uniref:Laminin, alpha 1 n=1 Tax=Lepisosteus oculatus TaxID=7918 RepID=W5M522_LEPOC
LFVSMLILTLLFSHFNCIGLESSGLFPAILNLASNAEISTNATCGEMGPEMFCKLVEHVPGRKIRNPQCRICDGNSTNPRERHPITNANDGTNYWWQSPSIKNGRQYHWVTITLDLRQVFQVAYIIIKAANSPRPGNWILERSLDGVEFQPWQYYAISDTECLTRYNVTPRIGPPTYKRDDEVICTSYYSRLVPLEHGEIHTSLINGRPGADELTPALLQFTSSRYIRLRLQRIRTLNADLMTLSYRDPKDVDPIVTRRYYYSIKDISVGGMCICYGHAQSCPWDEVSKKLQCVCEHNTCGESCNECCPGYHQKPWQPGTLSDGNTCEKCNCHNKAEDCYYNQTVADTRKSLNVHGQFVGGGVCVNCTQNTAGINCETCIDGYFRPQEVSPYAENPCIECGCDPYGSVHLNCVKDENQPDLQNGLHAGQCYCKEGYTGDKCDRCAFGFTGFPYCIRCNCSLVGSINKDPCAEECICKENVMGANCDLCKRGYYNLQESNPEGCTECFCFGVSDVCDSISWPIDQVVNTDGLLRSVVETDNLARARFYINGLPVTVNNTAEGRTLQFLYSWSAPEGFRGNKLTSYGGNLSFTVSFDPAEESWDPYMIALYDVIIEGNGKALQTGISQQLLLRPREEQSAGVEMVPGSFVGLLSRNPAQRDELLTAMANLTALRFRVHVNSTAAAVVRLRTASLDTADMNATGLKLALSVEHCECPWGYTGTSCEYCSSGFYRVGGILFGGNCMQCECNYHATECDINGACFDCDHNTTGPFCDLCLPGFYGDATNGTPDDCQMCACPLNISSNNFTTTNEKKKLCAFVLQHCTQYSYSVINCTLCADGYYGDPTVPGEGCVPCDCNGNVNPEEPGHCDPKTGECLKCIGNTAGPHCERCQEGYFGDAVVAKNCQGCGCYANSSLSSVCDVRTGRCECKPNVIGEKCDQCQPGYFGLNSGVGCERCSCSEAGSLSAECTEEGQCACVPGVAGDKCDRCQHGFYHFQDGGCKACDCAHTHNTCNPETGECICPPHTVGEKCEQCEDNYWGHDSLLGCKPCGCSVIGSSSSQCDLTSGQCQCHVEFGGRRCDQCALGFRAFPQCTACNCNINGTREQYCDEKLGVCGCEEDLGNCVCKDNVGGAGCDECKQGTFGLSADDPAGCSPCFCFGVSTECEELGGLVRVPIPLKPEQEKLRVVTQSNLTGTLEGVFLQAPDILLDASLVQKSLPTGPYYWRLPEQFQGNKLMAYGGKLRYTAAFFALEGSGVSNNEPQVLIKGGHLKKLVIYQDVPAPDNGVKTRQEIDLKEHKWKYFNAVSEKAVTHSDFMSVLSNIEYVIIKASYGNGLQQSRISNISMEVAFESEDTDGELARFIEVCECPSGYAGLSCQECAPGHYRKRVGTLSPRPLIEPCVPCQCSNHSQTCDLDTGTCQGCQHNTVGDHCDLCAPGYYGKVKGSINDCSLCACPHGNKKSFSPTCVPEGSSDFHCNACFQGYEGQYCERCSLGYYGNPSDPDGSCERCRCNLTGSAHEHCDQLTGQCVCKKGVRGHLCDECEPRHVLHGTECTSCDDDCTGVLLNDLDNLELSLQSVNLTGVILAPYSLLASLENTTEEVKSLLSSETHPSYVSKEIDEQLTGITDDINQLHHKVTQAYGEGLDLEKSTEQKLNQSRDLLSYITKMQTAIQALAQVASDANRTVDSDLDLSNSTVLQQEMTAMVAIMRKIDFTLENTTSRDEIKAARALLQQVQREFRKPQQGAEELRVKVSGALSTLARHLNDTQDLVNSAEASARNASQLLHTVSKNLAEFDGRKQNVSNTSAEAAVMIEEAQEALVDGLAVADSLVNITSHLEEELGDLELWNPMLRKRVDNLVMQMKKKAVVELVYRAEDHAAGLSKQADSLYSVLSDVRNMSFNATNAAQANSNIKADIEAAERQAEEAHLTAAAVLNLTLLSKGSMKDAGALSVQQSSQILAKATDQHNKTDGLLVRFNSQKDKLSSIQKNVQNISGQLAEPLQLLRSFPNDTAKRFQEAKDQAVAANASLAAVLGHLEDFRRKLSASSTAVAGASAAVQSTNDLVDDSEQTVNAAERKVKEMEARAKLLFERLKPLKLLEDNLSRNVSEIKELINQARKQAASIKVAVSADRDCVRAYKPEISSSNFNTLSLTVKTTEPDNLLFYMGSSSSVDFMAVEMRRGKVSFLWDIGSGIGRIEYPDLQINNNQWHQIHATRFGKQGTLTVQEVKSSQKPVVKTASSPGTSSVLHVNKSTLVFVGGLGGQIKKSSAVKMTHFKGCMGEATLNGKNIGLWNYAEREGKCKGCFMSPQEEDTSFYFDGSGYSVIEKSLRSTVTQVVMLFRTFSPNGLLLYIASNGTSDFVSIELVEGKVRLTFELGSGPLTLITTKTYNTGNWYKIAFQRNKKIGYLAVMDAYVPSDRETMEGMSPGNASDLNRSERDPIYIGGLPRSRAIRKQIITRSYVGCIKNVEISRSNFDLLRDAYGVRKGCVLEPIRSVTVLKEGFLELLPVTLTPQSEIMATFSTKNDTGLILTGFGKGGKRRRRQTVQGFLAVMLMNGRLEVHMNAADGAHIKKAVVKPKMGTFSDGEEHSLILSRSKRAVTVQVDDDSKEEMRLGPAADRSSLTLSKFYVGGIPPGEGAGFLTTTRSFYGCIQNLAFNMELLDLSRAARYQNVDMDSCLLEERPQPVVAHEEEDLGGEPVASPTAAGPVTVTTAAQTSQSPGPAECTEEGLPEIVPEAHQFGLSKNSHMILPISRNEVRKRFTIQLSLRTVASSGLVYYMANSNQVDYTALQLVDGRLFFTCDPGKTVAVATHPHDVRDGQWHTIKTEFAKKSVRISIDGKESLSVEAVGTGNYLDVEGKLYLGGLPVGYIAKKIGNVTHSVPACIRKVMLNNNLLDTKSPASVHALGSCYTGAQEGTYFEGTGFAALVKEGYKVRSDLAVALEFRTPVQDGVLLGISSAKVDAIGLELVKGEVLFHVNNGAGRISATYKPRGSSTLCDGKWHHLLANKTKHGLILTVDGVTVQTDNPHSQSTSADTNDPVYVGGFPGNVKQNCLTINTPFRGCMKNLRLVKGHITETYDFSTAFDLRGVFPHSCPGPQL